ncbi:MULTISPECIES: hypothetical protein [Bradyrhizobium]|nr:MULTISPECIES: hypothetical protein [Bradyrhizobium]
MSRADLLRQAENVERHADQATDEKIKSTLKKDPMIIGARPRRKSKS